MTFVWKCVSWPEGKITDLLLGRFLFSFCAISKHFLSIRYFPLETLENTRNFLKNLVVLPSEQSFPLHLIKLCKNSFFNEPPGTATQNSTKTSRCYLPLVKSSRRARLRGNPNAFIYVRWSTLEEGFLYRVIICSEQPTALWSYYALIQCWFASHSTPQVCLARALARSYFLSYTCRWYSLRGTKIMIIWNGILK